MKNNGAAPIMTRRIATKVSLSLLFNKPVQSKKHDL